MSANGNKNEVLTIDVTPADGSAPYQITCTRAELEHAAAELMQESRFNFAAAFAELERIEGGLVVLHTDEDTEEDVFWAAYDCLCQSSINYQSHIDAALVMGSIGGGG